MVWTFPTDSHEQLVSCRVMDHCRGAEREERRERERGGGRGGRKEERDREGEREEERGETIGGRQRGCKERRM